MCIWHTRRAIYLVGNSLDNFPMASEQVANFNLLHIPFSCDPSEASSSVEAHRTFGSWPVKIEPRKIYASLQSDYHSFASSKRHWVT
jgi:hypothetical protein